ncbi:MAG TPA: hypothetical protein VNT53_02340 [Pseudolysinimonas sp.]|nr:hypothetical protein [Pseudolysinimonas sp.]
MGIGGAGTAIMLALAAGLWFLYLMPSWVRRTEYLATERTATRLQQTVRVLAETSEAPDAMRIAATARDVARAERVVRAEQRRADAMVARQVRLKRAAAPAVAAEDRVPLPARTADAVRRTRIRRARRIASVLMGAATIVGLVQIGLIMTLGAVLGSWLVLGATLVTGVVAVALQRRLDTISGPRRQPATERIQFAPPAEDRAAVSVPTAPAPWTPVPVPQPLYLARQSAETRPSSEPHRSSLSRPSESPASAAPHVDPRAELRQAAQASEQALRDAASGPTVVPMRVSTSPTGEGGSTDAAAPNRFARMGIVDADDIAAPNLDEILQRRRNAG